MQAPATFRKDADDSPALVRQLVDAINAAPPALIARIGGDIELVIVSKENKQRFGLRSSRGRLELVSGGCADPVARIAMFPPALGWLLRGTLDVPGAIERRRLAVQGDGAVLGRLAACLDGPQSALKLRAAG